MDEKDAPEYKTYTSTYFEGRAIPYTVLIDSAGEVKKTWVGISTYQQMVDDILPLAKESS